jgi:AraC family transcriptional activator of pobA
MATIPIRRIKSDAERSHFADGFSIRSLQELVAEEDMVQGLHRHDFNFVLAVERGKGQHAIDFVSYPVSGRSLFFLRPGRVHELLIEKGSAGYLMAFNADFYAPNSDVARKVFRKAGNKTHCVFGAVRFKKLLSILSLIFQEYTGRQERYNEAIKAALDLLFIEFVRQSSNTEDQDKKAGVYAQERLEEFQELLHKHVVECKQVANYAGMLHLSPYQLNSITKSTVGKTCSELIDEQILLEAKRHLLATSNQVSQIAFELGYEDVSYFIRFFRKHTGKTPESFRQNFR